MASKEKTRSRAATTNREDGGAGALAGCVRTVCAANVALAAGGCAILGAKFGICGAGLPLAGLALAVVVSAAMVSALQEGRAE